MNMEIVELQKEGLMSKYLASDGHTATTEEKALLDYVSSRWRNEYQLSACDEGFHLCTRFGCCEFRDLNSLKEFLGEQRYN
jgi:hypothetical protein